VTAPIIAAGPTVTGQRQSKNGTAATISTNKATTGTFYGMLQHMGSGFAQLP